jgi:hypothetical protein
MTNLLTQILGLGGLLLMLVVTLVLRGLLGLLAGLTAVTCVVLVLCQMLVDKDYRKSSLTSESDRQKLLDGNG